VAAGCKETGGAVSALGFGTAAPRPAVDAKNDDNDDEDEGILDDDAARGILLAGDTVQAEYIGCKSIDSYLLLSLSVPGGIAAIFCVFSSKIFPHALVFCGNSKFIFFYFFFTTTLRKLYVKLVRGSNWGIFPSPLCHNK